jgi:hypothetical protein
MGFAYFSDVSVVLVCKAAASALPPSSPMPLNCKLATEKNTRLAHNSLPFIRPHAITHLSDVSVVLVRSAAARALAPSSPTQLHCML